jgi:hypothetical protein
MTLHLLCHCTVPVSGLLTRWINFDSGGCGAIFVYCSCRGENETESGVVDYNCTA